LLFLMGKAQPFNQGDQIGLIFQKWVGLHFGWFFHTLILSPCILISYVTLPHHKKIQAKITYLPLLCPAQHIYYKIMYNFIIHLQFYNFQAASPNRRANACSCSFFFSWHRGFGCQSWKLR
jgi:hypothetical protein